MAGLFRAPKGLTGVTFEAQVSVLCPYRENAIDEYHLTVEYDPQNWCASGGFLLEAVNQYEEVQITGEELVGKIQEILVSAIMPRWVTVTARLVNNSNFEMTMCSE